MAHRQVGPLRNRVTPNSGLIVRVGSLCHVLCRAGQAEGGVGAHRSPPPGLLDTLAIRSESPGLFCTIPATSSIVSCAAFASASTAAKRRQVSCSFTRPTFDDLRRAGASTLAAQLSVPSRGLVVLGAVMQRNHLEVATTTINRSTVQKFGAQEFGFPRRGSCLGRPRCFPVAQAPLLCRNEQCLRRKAG